MRRSFLHVLAEMSGQSNTLSFMKGYTGNLDTFDGFGNTPLGVASDRGSLSFLFALLKRGANVEASKGLGFPLLFARTADKIKALVTYGADCNRRDFNGVTPLHLRAHDGNAVAVYMLLLHGAATDVQDNHGFTPLATSMYAPVAVARLLIQYGANPNLGSRLPLVLAVELSNVAHVELLLSSGADPNIFDLSAPGLGRKAIEQIDMSSKHALEIFGMLVLFGASLKPSKAASVLNLFNLKRVRALPPIHLAMSYGVSDRLIRHAIKSGAAKLCRPSYLCGWKDENDLAGELVRMWLRPLSHPKIRLRPTPSKAVYDELQFLAMVIQRKLGGLFPQIVCEVLCTAMIQFPGDILRPKPKVERD